MSLSTFDVVANELFNVAREKIELHIREVLEEICEEGDVPAAPDIMDIYERQQAKLILNLPKKVLTNLGLTTWFTSFTGSLAHQQESGGWAYVEDELNHINSKPDLAEDWKVHQLLAKIIATPVWVGWAIGKYNQGDRFPVAIWPGAIFKLSDVSAWNDWNENTMKLIWYDPCAWWEESDGGHHMPRPPSNVMGTGYWEGQV